MNSFGKVIRSTGNVALTQSLFIEYSNPSYEPLWTIEDYDRTATWNGKVMTFPSVRRCYVQTMDPTDITFVDLYLEGNYSHWEKILANKAIGLGDKIEAFREEAALRAQSMALRRILEIAPTSQKDALQAAKYLGSRSWHQPSRPKQKQEPQSSPVDFDAERLGDLLNVVRLPR